MYLKRIVLHGFKSFADRTEFDFGPGLTMVVGPNGCGKSNIVDAVRWVLGEQSARSLRGHKMADVIFAGSRTRKPANAATVELTFDNRTRFLAHDASEVVVSRVLYRNGDSEYRLNGSPCRLKDIRHLFLDTGVGVEAYSIIEQGRVDQLLQANPVERREIFEEAAGISRYKVQRTEAERKLERTQANLLRVNDLVEELEKRLRSVKLAATKARKWQEYDARLRELRASFSLAEYHELECARRQAQARAAELNQQLQSLRAELGRHDAEAAEHTLAAQQLDERIQAATAQLAALQGEHATLAERLAQGERRLVELAALRERRGGQTGELAERMAAALQRLREDEAALVEQRAAVTRAAERVAELDQAQRAAVDRRDDARRALEAAKATAFEAVRRCALLHSEHNSLTVHAQRLRAQGERLHARRGELDGELAALTQQHGAAAERAAALDASLDALRAALQTAENQLEELNAARATLEGELAAAKETRSAVLSRLELLEDLERRLEGVDQGTQAVLAWRAQAGASGSVCGLVADLLRIDDPRVWLLQPLLATFENHVVVADAYAFLSELSRQAELPGPVRLLALDRLPATLTRADYTNAPGFVARAADWVTCAAEYRPLAEHLLGRVIVVDVMERALALAANAPDCYVFVTLDGRTVSTSGRLTVGAAHAPPGLISRKTEIRQLHQRLEEVETQVRRATRQRNELEQAASDAQVHRGELLTQIAGVQKEHAQAHTALVRAEGELLRAQREAAVLDSELAGVQRALAEAAEQERRLLAEASAAGQDQVAHESRIEALQAELAGLEEIVTRLAHELTEARVAAGRAAEKQAAGEEALAQMRTGLAALEQQRSDAQREADAAADQIEATRAELATARQRQAACAQETELAQAAVLAARGQRQELRQRQESAAGQARAVHERLRQVEAELHQCEINRRETDVRQDNLLARIRDDLAIDLAAQYASYTHTERDWDAVRAEIEDLRGRIARLGHVNLDALAELEELTPRYETLVVQRDDLVDSIARLQTLIAELDAESRARFAAAFQQIRGNFQELFRKLFGGGKADIILEDPERPLECGIEIIARPPGKEPQSISLLSGGEKTLTAVALLMAVFQSKPSPFAFLDEVDAALDEANTERFNMLLQEFLAHSQFVVVTHSKRTMQCADVLYGVTMEEPGVSKHVSVRLLDRVQTPVVA